MRYSRMNSQPPESDKGSGSKGTIIIIAILVIVGAVYIIGAAKVGGFISDKLITPVIAWVSGKDESKITADIEQGSPEKGDDIHEDTAQASSDAQTVSKDVVFKSYDAYMLQIGVFEDSSNALTLAEDMRGKGCAGYVMKDEEKFRVFISGYPNKDDAENVKQRILTDHEMDAKVYELETEEVMVTVETEPQVITYLDEAAEDMTLCLEKILEISQDFDKGSMQKDQAINKMRELCGIAAEKKSLFETFIVRTDNALIAGICSYYNKLCDALSGFENEDIADIKLSSDIKCTYIECTVAYRDFLAAGL